MNTTVKRLLMMIMALCLVLCLASVAYAGEPEPEPEPHGDVVSETVIKAPTCTKKGIGKRVYEDETAEYYQIDEIDHTPDVATMDYVEPTCTEGGKFSYKCAVCGAEIEEPDGTDPLGHDLVLDENDGRYVEPTCKNDDGVLVYKCSRCDAEPVVEENVQLPHTEPDEITRVEPTCTDNAKNVFRCTVCGEPIVPDEVLEGEGNERLGGDHDVADWTIIDEATCQGAGLRKGECTRCGAEVEDPIAQVDHQYEADEPPIRAATCTKPGIAKNVCKWCGVQNPDEKYVQIPNAHDWNEVVIKAATCGEAGEKKLTCKKCGYEYGDADIVGGEDLRIIAATNDHTWIEAVVDATCEHAAHVGLVCAVCEAIGEGEDVGEPLGHDYVPATDLDTYVAPTCTETGLAEYKCTRCGELDPERSGEGYEEIAGCVVAATGHEFGEAVFVEPTCTDPGKMVKTCSVCGAEELEDEEEVAGLFPALEGDHEVDEDAWEITEEATCEHAGKKEGICSKCGAPVEEVIPQAEGHDWVAGQVIRAATCTKSGIAKKVCGWCGEENGYMVTDPAHDWNEGVVLKAATCGEDGEKKVTCKVCKESEIQVIEASGDHTYIEDVKEATCGQNMWVGQICSVCGALGRDGQEIEGTALEHDYQLDTTDPEYKAATCTQPGLDVTVCKNCEDRQTAETPALGHGVIEGFEDEYVEATCTEPAKIVTKCKVCGVITNEAVAEGDVAEAALGHDWGAGDVIRAATCEKNGIAKKVCLRCGEPGDGYVVTEAAHQWNEGVVIKAATCGEDGEKKQTCALCGETRLVVIDATDDHIWEDDIVEATCTEPMKVGKVCSVCGAVDEGAEEVGDPLGHDYQLAPYDEEYADPSCTEDGLWVYVCSRCGDRYTEEQERTGHLPGDPEFIEATCTEGAKSITRCLFCEEIIDELTEDLSDVEPANNHTWGAGDAIREATCTKTGIAKNVCQVCGTPNPDSKYIITPADHKWNEGEVTKAATCGEEGEKKQTCALCGETRNVAIPATEKHTWVEDIVEPTCTEPGYVGLICSVCGAVGEDAAPVGEPLGHDYQLAPDDEEYADPTCMEDGLWVSICTRCGDRQREVQPAFNHQAGEPEWVDATCTENAKSIIRCLICEEIINVEDEGEIEAATGHEETAGDVMRAATCSSTGIAKKKCAKCGVALPGYVVIPVGDHVPGDVEIENLVEATCTEPGSYTEVSICTVCGAELEEEKVILAKGHTAGEPVKEDEEEPTCTEVGSYNEVVYCAECGVQMSKELKVVDALGHDPVDIAAATATCTTPGKTAGKKCSRCGEILEAQQEVAALGHTEVLIPEVPATCTEAGLTVGTKCSVCGEILIPQEEIPALGHTKVTIPGYAATCAKAGLTAGEKCSVCGEILKAQEPIAALAHTEEEIPAVAATCTTAGKTAGVKCSVCGEILIAQEEIPALGHKEEDIPAVAATCTEAGLTAGKKCSVCGEITVAQEVVAALGHTEEEIPAVAPTCTVAGMTAGKKCSVCGEILVAPVEDPAPGHTVVDVPAVAPTCTETGLTAGKKCSVCGEIITAQNVVKAKGHSYQVSYDIDEVDGVFMKIKTTKCTVCGEETVEYIELD